MTHYARPFFRQAHLWYAPGFLWSDTVRSFKDLISGKYDDLPEQAFYMVGSIDEVVEKAKKLKA